MGYPLGQWGSAVQAVSPPSFLCTLSLLSVGQSGKQRKSWCCASSVHE